MPPRRVLFDGDAFVRHFRSGITRYFSELIAEFEADDGLGVKPLTPYRYIMNEHLAGRIPGRFRKIPLPRSWRAPILDRLNDRIARRSPSADIVHHALYDPATFERWSAPIRACTVYDFTLDTFPELHLEAESALRDKRFCLERCDLLICISQATRDDLRRFHPDLDKPTFVTPLGVAEEFFTPGDQPIRGLPERYILHVGNRQMHKNVDVLFRAFAEIAKTDSTLRLVLTGARLPGETQRLDELGITRRTIRLRLTDDLLPALYHRAEAFVFPSLYEGFGLPVAEAMAAGCPTVIAEIPALCEVVADSALTFAPRDVETLVSHLQRLLGDPATRQRLRVDGLKRAAEFTWRRTAELTAAAYDRAARA